MASTLVKMSSKGQLVVPEEIRQSEDFSPGDMFVPVQLKEGILFRKVDLPDLKQEFARIAAIVEKKMKARKVSEADITEAIRWARKK